MLEWIKGQARKIFRGSKSPEQTTWNRNKTDEGVPYNCTMVAPAPRLDRTNTYNIVTGLIYPLGNPEKLQCEHTISQLHPRDPCTDSDRRIVVARLCVNEPPVLHRHNHICFKRESLVAECVKWEAHHKMDNTHSRVEDSSSKKSYPHLYSKLGIESTAECAKSISNQLGYSDIGRCNISNPHAREVSMVN